MIGAVFLDQGLREAKRLIEEFVLKDTENEHNVFGVDPRSLLCQFSAVGHINIRHEFVSSLLDLLYCWICGD